jgi:hypothetical protein
MSGRICVSNNAAERAARHRTLRAPTTWSNEVAFWPRPEMCCTASVPASLSAVAMVRDLRSQGSLTALTVRATQWANGAMRLS